MIASRRAYDVPGAPQHFDGDFSAGDLLSALTDAVILVDTLGVIRHVTRAVEHVSGYGEDELLGQPIEVLVPTGQRATHASERIAYAGDPTSRPMGLSQALALVRKDGTEIPVDIGLGVMRVANEQWTLAAIRDMSAHRTSERARLEVEQRFHLAFEDNMSPIIFTDLEDRIIAANDAFCQMIGYPREEILQHDSTLFTYPDDLGITEQVHRRIAEGELSEARYTKRYLHRDGRTVFVEVSKSSARDPAGNVLYYVISERDISDRVRRDLVLELRTGVSTLAMHASNKAEFLQQVCNLLVDQGGHALAWFGVESELQPGGVDIICAAGDTDYLYGDMASWWGSEESGIGPTGEALRTGVSHVIGDLVNGALHEPWRERAVQFGFGSSAAISERLGSQAAVLVLYSHSAFAFDALTVKGLEEILMEVKFANAHIQSVMDTQAALSETTAAINTLRETEEARAASEQRFRLAFENNMAPMVFSDLDDLAIGVNDAFCQMVGFSREELLGRDSTQFTFPEDIGITEETHQRLVSEELDQVRYVKRYLRKDGRVVISEVSRSAARDARGETIYFVSSERDITDERALTAQLSYQALHDPLTGLANRALFEDHLAQAHARIVRHGGFGAVLLLDLDDFKGVNDTHGHIVGDQLLVGIARRFELVSRSSDTLCRLGGDEFLYLAEGLASASEAEEVARRLLDVLTERFSFSSIELEQHASVGVVVFDGSDANFMDCVKEADVALYEAKRHQRGHHVVFNRDMHDSVISRFSLTQDLRRALQAGEISMHYQPIVDLNTTDVVGFEALMRWHHPVQGMVPPNVFIPLAEQTDLILDLGVLALREAISAATSWATGDFHAPQPYVTVNLSAHQFHNPGLVPMIQEALVSSGLAPSRLIIEITESVALLDATETMSTMSHLKHLGVRIALDDFGTGYSSLSYLALLEPEIIKIDRSFVSPEKESAHNSTLLEAIVSLGRKLNTTVLAEGIETQQQLQRVSQLGCQLGQGYLFSPAVPPSDVPVILERMSGNWSQELHSQPRFNLPAS